MEKYFRSHFQTLLDMNKRLITLLLALTFSMSVHAQGIRIVVEDVILGTANIALLTTGKAAVDEKLDEQSIKRGVGFGILYGTGLAGYDMYQSAGASYYVQGTLVSGGSTAKITLVDTFAGGALGAIIGTAVSLITNSELKSRAARGYQIGLWTGFAFGLVDGFVLSQTSDYPFYGEGDDFYGANTSQPGTIQVSPPHLTVYQKSPAQMDVGINLLRLKANF
jgi:hypothetical protein